MKKKKRKSLRGGVERPRMSHSYLCKVKEGAHHRMRAIEAKRSGRGRWKAVRRKELSSAE